jgi:hypothetical protein
MNTLSNTSSLPAKPVTLTVTAVVPLVAEAAPTTVPSGVVWSTPAKLAAPAMAPLATGPEKVTSIVPAVPLGGPTSFQTAEYRGALVVSVS